MASGRSPRSARLDAQAARLARVDVGRRRAPPLPNSMPPALGSAAGAWLGHHGAQRPLTRPPEAASWPVSRASARAEAPQLIYEAVADGTRTGAG